MTTSSLSRAAAALAAGGLFLLPLAACSGAEENTGSSAMTTAEDAAESAGSAGESAAESAEGTVDQNVDCSGSSCSVTLGSGAEAEVLGTTVSFESVDAGEATLRVGDRTVTCGEGESVSAGPLQVECTTISDDSIELTATLG